MLKDEILKIIGHGQEPERAELMADEIFLAFSEKFNEVRKSGVCDICKCATYFNCPFVNDLTIKCTSL